MPAETGKLSLLCQDKHSNHYATNYASILCVAPAQEVRDVRNGVVHGAWQRIDTARQAQSHNTMEPGKGGNSRQDWVTKEGQVNRTQETH